MRIISYAKNAGHSHLKKKNSTIYCDNKAIVDKKVVETRYVHDS